MGVTTIEALTGHIEKIRRDKSSGMKKAESSALSKEAEEIDSAIDSNESTTRNLYAQRSALVPELEKTNALIEQAEKKY